MKILVFSDIHGDTRALERLVAQPADIYIAAGDLSTFGRGLERCGKILEPLGQRVWLLPGNHETHEQTLVLCGRFGLVDFHRQVRTLAGAHWAGLGYSNPTPFDSLQPLYLVAHFPPQGTRLDEVAPGRHAGSRVLRAWIERAQPQYLFCGHIHECAGRQDHLGATPCFNVGKAGYLLEL